MISSVGLALAVTENFMEHRVHLVMGLSLEKIIQISLSVSVAILVVWGIVETVADFWPDIYKVLYFLIFIAFLRLLYSLIQKQQKTKMQEAADLMRAKAARLEADERRRKIEEREKKNAIAAVSSTLEEVRDLMRSIPSNLDAAEKNLSHANKCLQERSFYPFWDSLAEAAENMKKYKNSIDALARQAAQYQRLVIDCQALAGESSENFPKPFPVSPASASALGRGAETAKRIDHLYRYAHRDFEFSSIYANWRTNRTLIAGFENLSRGLEAIQNDLQNIEIAIANGFASVDSSIRSSSAIIGDAVHDAVAAASDSINKGQVDVSASMAEQLATARREQSANEAEMIDLLDNIQRRRERLPGFSDTIKQIHTKPV